MPYTPQADIIHKNPPTSCLVGAGPPLITAKLIQFCYMAEIQLNVRSGKYLQDQNSSFLTAISKEKREQAVISTKQIQAKMEAILKKLSQLQRSEAEEWSSIQQNKVAQLSRSILQQKERSNYDQNNPKIKVKMKALKQHLRLLVFICNRLEMEYPQDKIASTIRTIYFNEYGNQIFPYFKQVGFSTQEFEVVSYQQSSFFNLCCCWQSTAD